jgi:hypothetical protein
VLNQLTNPMLENSQLADSLSVVVRSGNGQVKDTRYIRPVMGKQFEFIPNSFYLKQINAGRIEPNTWKVPFLFGKWAAKKGTNK